MTMSEDGGGRHQGDPGPDPIGEYLRKKLPSLREQDLGRIRRPWRASPARIAGLSAAVLLVAGSAVLLATGPARWLGRTDRAGRTEIARGAGGGEAAKVVAGHVRFAEGEVALVRGSARRSPSLDDEILPGDRIETGAGAAAAIDYPAGHVLVLEGQGSMDVLEATPSSVRIGLFEGVIAGRIEPVHAEGERAALVVAGSNAEILVRGTVFTARAERGELATAAVRDGEVEVRSTDRTRSVRVGSASVLDIRTWTLEAGQADAGAVGRLASLVGEPAGEGPEPGAGIEPEEIDPVEAAPTLVEKIRQALDAGQVQEALALIESQTGGAQGADFHSLAGETYRRAGRWAEAAEAYMKAAEVGSGGKAETALLRAAELYLAKTGDVRKAVDVIDIYLARFPSGSHLDEGLYLGGAACSKSGDYARARALFEQYLDAYPGGPQAVKVHLALARILAGKMGDCKGALAHVEAVKAKAAGASVAAEIEKIEARCGQDPKTAPAGAGSEEGP